MRAANCISWVSMFAILVVTQFRSALAVTNFSHDMSTKTGWTAVQGGESGYVAAPDFVHGSPSHSSVTTAVSERQAFLDTNVDVSSLDDFSFSFRVMLHNTIAGVNEAVGRIGVLDNAAAPAGNIINAFVTLRRAGAIELTVQASDGVGGFNNIVNTNASMPNDSANGLSGYEFADFTVTRDSTGLWELDVINGYGNNVMNFTASESVVATGSNLNKVWVYDFGNQWNGSETAVYWDTVSVESTIPEPSGVGLLILGSLLLLGPRRQG